MGEPYKCSAEGKSRSQKAPVVSRAGGSIKAGSRQVVAILGLLVGLFPPAPSLWYRESGCYRVNPVITEYIGFLCSASGFCRVDHSCCGVDRIPVEQITVTVEWIGFLWSRSQLL